MSTERDLIQALTNALEVLYKEAVTAPHFQTLVIGGTAHPIPIGNDLIARDAIYADLLTRARAFLDQPEPEGPTDRELIDTFYRDCRDTVAGLRAVLARWGRPAVEPVPVSERPWEREGWCDNNGWCWGFDADDTDPFWSFDRPGDCACWTHLLPHYALPIPAPTEKP